jgi:predicted ATPase
LIARFGENPGIRCQIWSGLSLWFLGCPDQALDRARLAVNKAQDHLYSLAHAQTQLASVHQLRRDPHLAQQYAEMAVAVATEQAFPYRVAHGKILQGWATAVQGHVEDGMRLLRAGLDVCRKMGALLDYPYFLALLADACRGAGQVDEGLIALAGAQAMVLNSRSFYYEAELHRLKGDLLLQTSRASKIDDAETCFVEALGVARRQGAKLLELRAAVSLGRLWQQQGKQAEAHHLVAEACGWFTEGFDTVDLQQARAFLQDRECEGQAVSQAEARRAVAR